MVDNFTLPTVNDTQDLLEIFRFVNNSATGGLFFPLVLFGIWIIAFIGTLVEGREVVRGWIFASFITSILGILLSIMGMLNVNWVYLMILFLAVGLFWIRLQNPPPS